MGQHVTVGHMFPDGTSHLLALVPALHPPVSPRSSIRASSAKRGRKVTCASGHSGGSKGRETHDVTTPWCVVPLEAPERHVMRAGLRVHVWETPAAAGVGPSVRACSGVTPVLPTGDVGSLDVCLSLST